MVAYQCCPSPRNRRRRCFYLVGLCGSPTWEEGRGEEDVDGKRDGDGGEREEDIKEGEMKERENEDKIMEEGELGGAGRR